MLDMVDPYSHQSPHLFYSPTNLPGPGCPPSLLSHTLAGCDCTTTCTTLCSHLTQYGSHYHTSRLVQVMGDTDAHRPVVECNDNCACDPSRCGNRVVQAGPGNNLQVEKLGSKGWGVRAGVDMSVGEFVCEYAGEVIGEDVAKARAAMQGEGEGNYIMVLREYAGEEMVQKTIVDPTGDGGVDLASGVSLPSTCSNRQHWAVC